MSWQLRTKVWILQRLGLIPSRKEWERRCARALLLLQDAEYYLAQCEKDRAWLGDNHPIVRLDLWLYIWVLEDVFRMLKAGK